MFKCFSLVRIYVLLLHNLVSKVYCHLFLTDFNVCCMRWENLTGWFNFRIHRKNYLRYNFTTMKRMYWTWKKSLCVRGSLSSKFFVRTDQTVLFEPTDQTVICTATLNQSFSFLKSFVLCTFPSILSCFVTKRTRKFW